MRFAFCGCDRNLSLLKALLDQGWELVQVFATPQVDTLSVNQALLALASLRKIPVQLEAMHALDIQHLSKQSCDILINGSYNYRIPEWREYLPYAINFHPSPLPNGRGPYPLPCAILRGHTHWGLACHQIDAGFDTGAILAVEHFALDALETHESLSLKLEMAAPRLVRHIVQNFSTLWNDAQVQPEGEYWPMYRDEDRYILTTRNAAYINLQLRAFLGLSCLAQVQGQMVKVTRGQAWSDQHTYIPGQLVHERAGTIVLACVDGYVAFYEWQTQ